jgi:hypothetical protein
MSLSERLDELRHVVPSCTLASFGDISTGLALRTSASDLYKQEYLDEVLRQASANFELSDLMSDDNDLVVLAVPDEIRIFVRYQADNPDVVCCICDDVSDVPLATRSARKILTDMAGAL